MDTLNEDNKDRLKEASNKTRRKDSVVVGSGKMNGQMAFRTPSLNTQSKKSDMKQSL